MQLQEICALPLTASVQALTRPDGKFDQPVMLSTEEISTALQKADNKSAHSLQKITLPTEEPLKQLVLDLVTLNREIELAEAKYRKALTEETHTLATRIRTLQEHKTRLSTMVVTNLCV